MAKSFNRGQVAPFMILVVAVLILAIAATMLIGEAGFQRIRLANVADAALISSASDLCRSLNQIRTINRVMLSNYCRLAAQMMSRIYPTKEAGQAKALELASIGIYSNRQLFKQAQDLAEDTIKKFRVALYDGVLQSGLVDEPKPFKPGEVTRDPNNPDRITGLNYDAYTQRPTHFTEQYRSIKKQGGWYNNHLISYSFNKSKQRILAKEMGRLGFTEPDTGFESYLRAEFINAPTNISVELAPAYIIVFRYWDKTTDPPHVSYGIIPHPWPWLREIRLDSDTFGFALRKGFSLKGMLLFAQHKVELEHRNRIHIFGNVGSPFRFQMEE